jgi:hypothetical protein
VQQRWNNVATSLTTPYFSVSTHLILMNGSSDNFRWLAFQTNTSAGANTISARFIAELVYPT